MSHHISEQCKGCTLCASLCPVLAITGEKGSVHTINEKRCVDCGVCGRACPAGAVSAPDGAMCRSIKRPEWKKPEIDTFRCSACGMCVAVCRAGALAISQPAFRGDIHVYAQLSGEKKCVGCSLCAAECPLNAIKMGGREDENTTLSED